MLSLLTILGIAIALAMDAFAVSICYGCGLKQFSTKVMLVVAAAFAVFQGGMTIIGWLGGRLFAEAIQAVDHFVAFGLLTLIGGKMIYEAFTGDDTCEVIDPKAINIKRLLVLSLATSIDALAVGLSFSLLEMDVIVPSIIITIVTLVFAMIGVAAGHGLKKVLGRKVEIIGGVILILIGIQILITHLSA
ncbi:MAG: manganese efflux pump MntP family protein [Candidatus Marinimicrobia bacterium]|nr:manganese efflux pump MntP family protein [Candidatus Neomarinimicrobiota bacterium]